MFSTAMSAAMGYLVFKIVMVIGGIFLTGLMMVKRLLTFKGLLKLAIVLMIAMWIYAKIFN